MKILSCSWPTQFINPSRALVAALFALAFAVAIAAQDLPKPPTPRPMGQSVVSGRVIFEDTGQPAARVRVDLVATRRADSRPPGPFSAAMTNEQGEFKFSNVAAGDYVVSAQLDPRVAGPPPAVATTDTQPRPGSAAISVDGRSNAQVELKVPNPHFGTISGYVLRAGGDVAANTRVNCTSTDPNAPFALSVNTDDKGAYRLERVPAGEYLLSADPPRQSNTGASELPLPSLVPTYYPSAASPAVATPITVGADVETPGINITLIERTVHRVSGTVKFRNGDPVAHAAVQLNPTSSNVTTTPGEGQTLTPPRVPPIQSTDENGAWSFSNIPDGEYVLRVDARQLPPVRSTSNDPAQSRPAVPKFTAKQQRLTVAGADLTEVAITVSGGARISGTVVVEGDRSLPANLGITAGVVNSTESRPASTTIQADGSFALTGVPEGDVWILPQLRPANTFYVKAIDANGIDLTRAPLKVDDGAEVKNVRIVVSSGVGILTGRVLSANGNTPLARTSVVLIPVDPEKQKFSLARFTAFSAADGSFTIGAAPGDYIVLAYKPPEQPPRLDAESLSQIKLRVSLQPGERKNFDILK